MWIFLNDAFFSIVADRKDETKLLVRARRAGDLERYFPNAGVTESRNADYRYRAFVPRLEVAIAMMSALNSIDYPNFKDSVGEADRHDAYMNVWSIMHRYQSQAPQ